MKKRVSLRSLLVVTALLLTVWFSQSVAASQDDNSLYALGITTEGAVVEPDFSYDTWEYTVTVPAGTQKLELDPVPSAEAARIASVTGTELDEEGTGTVLITVEAGNGDRFSYTLHVVSDGALAAETETEKVTEKETEPETEAPTEPETEDARYVRVDRNTVEEAEDTIRSLKNEISEYRKTINFYTRIMFGLIALSVILLFLVINLLIRKKDLKAELKEYRSLGYAGGKSGKKAAKKALKAQKAASGGKKGAGKAKNLPSYEQEQPTQGYQQPQQRMMQAQQAQAYAQAQAEQAARAAQARMAQGGQAPGRMAGGAPQQPQQVQSAPARGPQQTQDAVTVSQPQQVQSAPARGPQQTQDAVTVSQPQQVQSAPGNAPQGAQGERAAKKEIQINMIDL